MKFLNQNEQLDTQVSSHSTYIQVPLEVKNHPILRFNCIIPSYGGVITGHKWC